MTKQTMRIAILTVLLVLTGCGTDTTQIGFVAPLSGDAAQYGKMEQRSVQLAMNDTSVPLELLEKDGKCTGKAAATAAQQLITTSDVQVILGGLCSGETLAMAPIANDNEVVLFSSTSTSPNISQAGPYVFRNAYSDTGPARSTAELALDNGHDTMAVVSAETAYASSYKDVFMTTYTENGGRVLLQQTYGPNTKDFNSIATKIDERSPDAVFISPQNPSGALLAQRLEQLGYDGALYGNSVLTGSDILEQYRSLEGMYVSTAAGLNTSNPAVQRFLDEYKKAYGEPPQIPYFAGARYDSLTIIATAIQEVGYDGEAIKNFLQEYTHEGVLGTYRFDDNGDIVGINYEDKQVRNGTTVTI